MRPLRIYLKNFMSHKQSEIDCTNFHSALIVGKSRKNDRVSNGVGKTTIFRAIEYAIYNQSHATTLDKVVKDGKKRAVVEFDFELLGGVYRIWRQRNSTGTADVRLYQRDELGNWLSITARTPSATDAKIRDLVKLSHKAFTYSVLFRQADLTGLSSVDDPKKRKEILKEPLNLVQFTKLEEIAAKKAKPFKKEIERLEASIAMLGEPLVDITKAELDLHKCQFDVEDQQKQIKKTERLIDERKKAIEKFKLSLNYDDLNVHTRIAEHEVLIADLNKSITAQGNRITNLLGSIKASEDAVSKCVQKIETSQKLLDDLVAQPTRDLNVITTERNKVSSDEVKGSELIAEVKAEIRLIKKSLPDGDNCPACQQPITKEYRCQVEAEVQRSLEKKSADLAFYEDALGKCKRKLAKLEAEQKSATDRLNNIKLQENSLKSLNNEKSTNEKHLSTMRDEKELTEKKWAEDDEKLKATLASFNDLKEMASKSDVSNINNKIFTLNEEIKVFQKSVELFESRVANLKVTEGSLLERIKTRKSDKDKLVVLKDQLLANEKELRLHQLVVDAFSHRGIPTFIIQTMLDDLQYETNVALKEIRPELDIQIDADLNIEYRRFGVLRDYSQLSHGQQVYLALAFKRGLSRVIQKRLGIDIRLLVLDEVDAHLDEAGVEAFADSIAKWQKEFTVFVITHNKDLKDKFSHAILVEEDDDGSEARLVNTW